MLHHRSPGPFGPPLLAALLLLSLLAGGPASASTPGSSSASEITPSWHNDDVHSMARFGVDMDAPYDHRNDADDPGDLVWEAFTNPAYQCQASGDFWFFVLERVEDAPLRRPDGTTSGPGRVRPLVVGFTGMNVGTYDEGGTSVPGPGVYGDAPPATLEQGATPEVLEGQSEAIRRAAAPGTLQGDLLAEGWRGLSPGTCDTDAFSGLGTSYPNHPDAGQTVDGALAAMAAIEHVVTSTDGMPAGAVAGAPLRPTGDIVLAGSSAGAIGVHAVMDGLRHARTPLRPNGIAVTGAIVDSGIVSTRLDEVWRADDGLRLPATFPSLAFLTDVGLKLSNPALHDASRHPEAAVADGIDVPMLAMYDDDDFACGASDDLPPFDRPAGSQTPGTSTCSYAYGGFGAAVADPDAHPSSELVAYDLTGEGWSAHGLLDQAPRRPTGADPTSEPVPHPAVAVAEAWIDEVRAAAPSTPWPYLPVHALSQVSQDPSRDPALVDAVSWAVDRGVVDGYDGPPCGTHPSPCFQPGAAVSRQAMAAFLHRLSGSPPTPPPAAAFSDVGPNHPFAAEVEWLAAEGLATGYDAAACRPRPAPCFRPAAPITRQSAAAFLSRLAQGRQPASGGTAATSFSDVSDRHPFAAEIGWMARHGISAGYDATACHPRPAPCFQPSATVTRRALVPFLHRLASRGDAWDVARLPAPEHRDAVLF